MPVIIPTTQEVTQWQGFHLFHYGMSNCSQRIRIMLEEKGIAWTSHIVDIPKEENLTEWYQGINPNGVVPTLVHDGQVIIESSDILKYLKDYTETETSLPADLEIENQVIALSDAGQNNLKVLSFQYLFKPFAKKSKEQLNTLDKKLKNRELYQFHKTFSSDTGMSVATIRQAVWGMHSALDQLNTILAKQPWLSGSEFGIADATWAVNIRRMELMCFPLTEFPHVRRWFRFLKQKPSYQKGLKQYEVPPALAILKVGAFFRVRFGQHSVHSILAMGNSSSSAFTASKE
jgi:glutathione S-transferase